MTKFTEDERINIRLRRKAGETVASLAEDYDCLPRTIRNACIDPAVRAKHHEIQAQIRRIDRLNAEKFVNLRDEMAREYTRRTGRNLLVDLKGDSRCLLPRSSLQPPATSTATKKHSSNI